MQMHNSHISGLLIPGALLFLPALCCVLFFSGCAEHHQEDVPVVFYPKQPERPRLQFLTSLSSEEDLTIKRSGFQEYLFGPEPAFSDIGRPYDVNSSAGKIYVVDRKYNAILIIDLLKKSFNPLQESMRGALRTPAGIWVSREDVKYVADMQRRQIVVLSADNDFIRAYGEEVLERPVDVAVHENKIYVCDILRHRIVVLDKISGDVLMHIGEIGKGEGQFYKPTHITVDERGNLFVNDAFNFRVQEFDVNGNFIRVFGFHGDLIGAMARSKGLAIDREKHLYVADAAFEHVQIFDQDGRLLLYFGGPGRDPGNMNLPAGVHIDYDNVEYFNRFAAGDFKLHYLLYVCNMSGPDKINVYGYGEWLGD